MVSDIGVLVLRPLQDYSAGSLLLALSNHALEYGSLRYLYSDSGSQLKVFHNKMNEPGATIKDHQKFDKIWRPLLTDEYRSELKKIVGQNSLFSMLDGTIVLGLRKMLSNWPN